MTDTPPPGPANSPSCAPDRPQTPSGPARPQSPAPAWHPPQAAGYPWTAAADATWEEPVTVTVTFTLTCDRCGDDADTANLAVDTDDGDGRGDPVTFIDALVAAGWQLTDGTVTCPACLLRAACETTGHRWGPWTTLGPSLTGRHTSSRCRHCRVCTAGEFEGLDQSVELNGLPA